MKKFLIIFLAMFYITIPAFNNIDAFERQNSKLLIMNRPVDAFSTNIYYKIKC